MTKMKLRKSREGYAQNGDTVEIIEKTGATDLVRTDKGFVFRAMLKHLEPLPTYQFYVYETKPEIYHVELFLNEKLLERATENIYNAKERIFEWAFRYDINKEDTCTIHDGENTYTMDEFLHLEKQRN